MVLAPFLPLNILFIGRCTPPDASAAARNLLDEDVSQQGTEHRAEGGQADAAQQRIRSAARYCAGDAFCATACKSEQPPLPPRHPQRPPDGGHIVEPPHAAVQLACPGHDKKRAAAGGIPRNDRSYDLINTYHQLLSMAGT